MQLHKFYGRTIKATLSRVRAQLGDDAMILETRSLAPDSPAARMNPGALYEVCAVREAPGVSLVPPAPRSFAPRAAAQPRLPRQETNLIADLGLLRAQIRELLDGNTPEERLAAARIDLHEYQALIDLGVDSRTLAPHFRAWLQWRTASPVERAYLDRAKGSVAPRMEGESLREWLWLAWSEAQGMSDDASAETSVLESSHVVGLLGATGVGKTTTLAKISSKLRHEKRQNSVIVTLDTHRFGAAEQIRRFSKLLGVGLHEVVTQADLMRSMETWGNYDWVGIDTPGGMTLGSEAGRLYGYILAQMAHVQSMAVLPAGINGADGRAQMTRAKAFGAQRALFSKLDETSRPGGMVNLTMDGQWKIDSMTTGQKVPGDWRAASGSLLWNRVLAPDAAEAALEAGR